MADTQIPFRRLRLMRIALVVSVALNLAVAGLALGFVVRGHDAGPPRGFDMSLGPVARALSPEDRAAIRETLKSSRVSSNRRGGRDADLAALIAALTRNPYDPEETTRAITAPAARVNGIQAAAAAALADRVAQMTEADRKAFAARLAESSRRR